MLFGIWSTVRTKAFVIKHAGAAIPFRQRSKPFVTICFRISPPKSMGSHFLHRFTGGKRNCTQGLLSSDEHEATFCKSCWKMEHFLSVLSHAWAQLLVCYGWVLISIQIVGCNHSWPHQEVTWLLIDVKFSAVSNRGKENMSCSGLLQCKENKKEIVS